MRSGRLKALDDVVMKEMSACEFRENTFFFFFFNSEISENMSASRAER